MKVSTLVFVAVATIGHFAEGLPTTPDLANYTDTQEPLFRIGGPLLEEDEHEHEHEKRDKQTDTFRAVGLPDITLKRYNCVGGYAYYRQEIRKFETDQGGRLLDLYMCAMKRMYARPPTEPNSYWALAGIHGRPFQAWPNPNRPASQNTGTGYCHHGSCMFPHWHRPLISYFEQVVFWNAQLCVTLSHRGTAQQRQAYANVLPTLRQPYWDWATNNAQMPNSYTQPTWYYRNRGLFDDTGSTFSNPLYRYTFPNGYYNNPNVFGGYPWTSRPYTLRSPSSNTDSNMGASQNNLGANAGNLRSNVYNLLLGVGNWAQFSNHQTFGNSLESIHDAIHVYVGGNDGHMAIVPYSAFDPIFWLHHTNVDRLFAIWQAIWPRAVPGECDNSVGVYGVNPGKEYRGTGFTPIANYYYKPHTFDTARDTSAFCYAYPETPKWKAPFNRDANQYTNWVKTTVYNMYGPNVARAATKRRKMKRDDTLNTGAAPVTDAIDKSITDDNKYFEWRIDISVDKSSLNSTSFTVPFFLGKPGRNASNWVNQEEYVGSYAVFAGGMAAPVGIDPNTVNKTVTGTVPLTDGIVSASVRFNVSSLNPNDTIPFLEKTLRWRCLDNNGKACSVRSLKDLKVTVSTSYCTLPTDAEPWVTFGPWNFLAEIVRKIGTDGGPDSVGSVPSPSATVASTTPLQLSTSSAAATSTTVGTTTSAAAAPVVSSSTTAAADVVDATPVADATTSTTTYATSAAAPDDSVPTSTSLPAALL
ncbi:Tyrosinase [Orbilia brochopaga]|nr:Tyrosinase [Drechslerella brochopaga]